MIEGMRTGAAAVAGLWASAALAQPVFEPLGLAPTMPNGFPMGVAADGSVVVGVGNGPTGLGVLAFRWTRAGGSTLVPPLPGFTSLSALGVSGDGCTAMGINFSPNYALSVPYVWRSGA